MLSHTRKLNRLSVETLEQRALLTATAELVDDAAMEDTEFRFSALTGSGDDIFRLADYDSLFESVGRVYHHWVVEDQIYVEVRQGAGRSLWKTDGTDEGTSRLLDVHGTRELGSMTVIDNELYFSIGNELWKSDGTEAGTNYLLSAGNMHTALRSMTEMNDQLFLVTDHGELWASDGTQIGTTRVFGSDDRERFLRIRTTLNDQIYFSVDSEDWISDGTATGTRRLEQNMRQSVVTESQLFYTTDEGELWRTDGTQQGTYPLQNAEHIGYMTLVGDRIFYLAGTSHRATPIGQLWGSDGTPEGTRQLTDAILKPSGHKHGCGQIDGYAAGDSAYFLLEDENGVDALWTSDGTRDGTVRLDDRWLRPLVATDGMVYLAGFDEANGTELWRTDGTPQGTVQVLDLNPGPASSIEMRSAQAVIGHGMVYFTADDGVHGRNLWRLPIESPPDIDWVMGDSNHDGIFDSSDLVLVFQAGKYENKDSRPATFEEGDWNGDGVFDSSDLVFVFQSDTYASASQEVPSFEPIDRVLMELADGKHFAEAMNS